MEILIDEKQYLEVMKLLNIITRENKKYLSLIKQLDKSKKNNIRKRLIAAVEKWVECEVTGDEAMAQIIELLEIKLTN
ncbi:hypothetical protein FDB15_17530 [Clostridium botulinum]|nr:hypothetical protein [Clostridium botulinum]NFI64828.1 hypothetical protein [Clostridium botulinum]NFJ45386.1 hypothetical protein [Clostridium botulinum]NFJ49106.1 hypothetical protein [Clostridium botulinum]NFK26989.1 hypothetical protein [Clostridium botulinum]